VRAPPASQDRALVPAGPEPLRVSSPSGSRSHGAGDDDPYWDYDDHECWNCGGEGFTYGCSWDWQCDTYDEGEGTCLCTRRCDYCNPAPVTAAEYALRQVLAASLAQEGVTEGDAPSSDSQSHNTGRD
jgi:hypothetical protein